MQLFRSLVEADTPSILRQGSIAAGGARRGSKIAIVVLVDLAPLVAVVEGVGAKSPLKMASPVFAIVGTVLV